MYFFIMLIDSSFPKSLTNIISISSSVWLIIESMQSSIYFSTLYVGRTIDNFGDEISSCSLMTICSGLL